MCWTERARPAARALLPLALGAGALILAGCAKPAGGLATDESFGMAPRYNIHVQAGGRPAADRLRAMAAAFARETPNRVTFDFDSTALDAEARADLAVQARWLTRHPGTLVRIYGHTDLVGAEGYNERLGLNRARAAARTLIEAGVAANRIALVASRGERDPVVPVEARERRNRRAVTRVEGYGAGWRGGGFDGKRALLGYFEYSRDQSEAVEIDTTADGG